MSHCFRNRGLQSRSGTATSKLNLRWRLQPSEKKKESKAYCFNSSSKAVKGLEPIF